MCRGSPWLHSWGYCWRYCPASTVIKNKIGVQTPPGKQNLIGIIATFQLSLGAVCCCKFSEDSLWYRGLVKAVNGDKATVHFVDYGNRWGLGTLEKKFKRSYTRGPHPSLVTNPSNIIVFKHIIYSAARIRSCQIYSYSRLSLTQPPIVSLSVLVT